MLKMKQLMLTDTPTALVRATALGLALAMMGIAPASASETDTPEPTAQSVSLNFITIDVAPWAYRSEASADPQGAFPAIVARLEQLTGYTIHMTLTPFARVDRELESGDHDCTILVPRDEQIVRHGEVITGHDIGVLSRSDNPITDYADLQGKRISLLRGSSISEEFDQDPDILKEYDTDYLMALRKLDRERINGIAGAIPTLLYLAQEHELSDMLAEPLKLSEIPLMLQCSRNSEHLDLMESINAAARQMREDGSLQAIVDRYHF